MYEVKLKKLESNHNNIDSEERDGIVHELPSIGKRFFMYSNCSMRAIQTTEVMEIVHKRDDELIFKTHNSVYLLTDIKQASKEGEANEA